jgi:high-affinity iron transporter
LPDPTGHGDFGARVLDIAVLVFREGLECILVLSAITANMIGPRRSFQRPVAAGAGAAFLATLLTWGVAITIIDSLADNVPALDLQAATGLLAILVLLLVMNWFFHKVYWAGWISLHSRRKQTLLKEASDGRLWWGLALLGFSSLYREGFEIVLFLQSYRLKLGGTPVLYGVSIGLALTTIVGVLTFVAHRRLPYRRMLVFTGVMLGLVLLVMVGEQAQEMQLARWLPTTPIAPLEQVIPGWMGLWFAIFPTVETLAAQILAAAIVVGSFVLARPQGRALQAGSA